MDRLTLYTYWRSSAAWRVRIALALKGLDADQIAIHLVKAGGQQHSEAYLKVNPHGLIPALIHHKGGRAVTLTNSLAIIEYLDEVFPKPPLLPEDAASRARVRQICQTIAGDIHPLQNLRVLQMAARVGKEEGPLSTSWAHHWINVGFKALENQLSREKDTGRYAHGHQPTMADLCIIPQIANAERYGIDMADFPTLAKIDKTARDNQAFEAARPENQPDAE